VAGTAPDFPKNSSGFPIAARAQVKTLYARYISNVNRLREINSGYSYSTAFGTITSPTETSADLSQENLGLCGRR
jgi:hypothetical protein